MTKSVTATRPILHPDNDTRPYPRPSIIGAGITVTPQEGVLLPARHWERTTDQVLVLDAAVFTAGD